MYITLSQPAKAGVYKENFNIKSNIIDQIHFLEYRNSRLVQYLDGLCMFKNIICAFSLINSKLKKRKKVLTNIYIRS